MDIATWPCVCRLDSLRGDSVWQYHGEAPGAYLTPDPGEEGWVVGLGGGRGWAAVPLNMGLRQPPGSSEL